jgi:hypothetical protein
MARSRANIVGRSKIETLQRSRSLVMQSVSAYP